MFLLQRLDFRHSILMCTAAYICLFFLLQLESSMGLKLPSECSYVQVMELVFFESSKQKELYSCLHYSGLPICMLLTCRNLSKR
jgi:hypothetical protein